MFSALSFKLYCVVPENIHTPPQKGLEIPEGWGGQRPRNFRRGGGVDSMNLFFFFQTGLNIILIQLYVNFCCLHFTSRVADAKKINLANLKHKMHIFELVWLDIVAA